MTKEGYRSYLNSHYNSSGSRAASSYYTAIAILDNIFRQNDLFCLNGTSLCCLDDIDMLLEITEFVKLQEGLFRTDESGIFSLGNPKQKSYPKGRFCSAAMKSLISYYESCKQQAARRVVIKLRSGALISKKLISLYGINDYHGEDVVRETKARIGQSFFRKMLLENYNGKCGVTGLDVPEVLRASHIVAWSEDKNNRMNPENGIILSATYDAAFDQHLISFDENYRMIVSKEIKDHYTSEVAKEYFLDKEGLQLALPSKFPPNQLLLQKHRELMVG